MNKSRLLLKRTFLFLVTIFCVITPVTHVKADFTLNWTKNTSLPYEISSQSSEVFENKIFNFGGSASTGQSRSDSLGSVLNELGTLDSWTLNEPYPNRLIWHSSTKYLNHIYLLGGYIDGIGGMFKQISNVYHAQINLLNNIDSWDELNSLPKPLARGSSISVGKYIYLLGGETTGNVAVADVYYAPINADGSIGVWSSTSSLPLPSFGITAVADGDSIYVLGRRNGTQIFKTTANADGTLEPWVNNSNLLYQAHRASVAKVGKRIFVVGGIGESTSVISKVQYADINDDGSLSGWSETTDDFPRQQCCSPAVEAGGRLLVIGGHDGGGYFADVWSSDQLYVPNPTPTLAITPTPTPSPSPTPTPVLVTKTVLVPGFGGSWNQDAILNCKNVNYSGEWSLSPLAERVYEPFINAMHQNNKYVYPFYYDWRRDVRESASKLREYVAGLTSPGEKVDIVGHSFGGLVARAYAQEVGDLKIRKVMLVGTPNQGSIRAYPSWSGAEIWNENPIFAAAQSLVIQRCGGGVANRRQILRNNFPSIQNFLPTVDYLRDWLTNQVKPLNSMEAKNNWLPNTFNDPWGGVTLGTLAGTNKKTAVELKVRAQSKIDKVLNIWDDGKPIGAKNSNLGDDTVLVASAQILGADNRTVKQSHWGVMAANNSVTEILDFLGPSPLLRTAAVDSPEIQTALLIVSADSQVTLTDKDGKNTQSRDGVIFIPNPKKNAYKVKVDGQGKNRKFSVGQFLGDGKMYWKDYGFTNKSVWIGKLNFDDVNPNEDVVK